MTTSADATLLRLRGLVQGVGFRPYVWRLATALGLSGWVRNDGAGVMLAVAGERLAEFRRRLPQELPPLARLDAIEEAGTASVGLGFTILASDGGPTLTAIGPDAAVCPDCVAELCDPANRRWRYAFTTCTHCGPRYTVTAALPYDRPQTSLAPFPLCPACAGEYGNPADRRFHAETTCCPDCGPQLRLLDAHGQTLPGDPVAGALARLRAGGIVALKGLGGFHLACDAHQPAAVAALRERKAREAKPFAVMGLNAASLAGLAQLSPAARTLLASPAAPIVLCPKTAGCDDWLPGVAPALAEVGVMLPATPLHLLLWHEAAGRPTGTDWRAAPHELLLVMTSANPQGEPLVTDNDEALTRLAGIADAYLLHDRAIRIRCDDSVVRPAPESDSPTFLRRARGYVPLPIPLAPSETTPTVLALGPYLKNTVCVIKGNEAFLSQHIGSLDNAASRAFLADSVRHLLHILDARPDLIAHDLHPDFPSTELALALAAEWQVPAIAVGHHHAHIAALAAEHQHRGPLLGLALDGVGLGTDGSAWGGELLRVDGAECQRLGHLQPLRLPGGDRAAREPWRMAVAALVDAGLGERVPQWLARHWPERDAGPLLTMLARDLRCPPTTSLGRLFDAAAGLLGVREVSAYEGQAAMELEALAISHGTVAPLADGYRLRAENGLAVLDFRPLWPALLGSPDTPAAAALFHHTLAAGLADWAIAAAETTGIRHLAIGGGCALNTVLLAALRPRLAAAGLTLLQARQAPANDGGLALGQAWVARQVAQPASQQVAHSLAVEAKLPLSSFTPSVP